MAYIPEQKALRKIQMLADLPPWQMEVVTEAIEPVDVVEGGLLVERGTDDGYTYFLTEGRIALDTENGQHKTVEVTPDTTRTPFANLRPRIISVKALTRLRGFRVPDIVLSAAGCGRRTYEADDIKVESQEEEERRQLESKLSFRLYRDLQNDKAILPSLPDLAMRIRRAIDDDMSSAREVSKLVEADPAMATKLLKVANSAYFGGANSIETLSHAVVRLGMQTTKQLVVSCALKDVFRNKDPQIQQRMQRLWRHSANIAALSFVLAGRVGTIEPEEALLVGLVHDVGTIAILNYLEKFPALADDPEALEETISNMRGEMGAMILREWKFAPAVVAGARDAEYWTRIQHGAVDFVDLLIVAQVHDRLRKNETQGLPPIEKISAIQRVLGDEAGPEESLQVLREAKAQVDEMRSVLHG